VLQSCSGVVFTLLLAPSFRQPQANAPTPPAYNGRVSDPAEDVARTFVDAINRRDVADLADRMTAEHRFIDSLGNVVEGSDKMRAGWAAYFRMVPDYSITIDEVHGRESVVVLLGSAQGTYAADGQLREENRWQTPAAFRAVIQDGKIAEWRVYADNDPIRRLMARKPQL
jgi:ketosteroid isomerase-like protein